MQTVDLNLASRPFKNDTLVWGALVSAVLLLGFVTWWNVDAYTRNRALLADLEQSQASLRERVVELDGRSGQAVRQIESFDLPAISVKTSKANHVIRWKAFSWTRLFNLLQEVQPYNVQMTSIHPVFRGDALQRGDGLDDPELVPVSVEGVAKTLGDFLALERELIFSPHFDRVEPERHTRDETSDEWVFRLRFLYDPRVAEEEDQLLAEVETEQQDEALPVDVDAAGGTEGAASKPEPAAEELPAAVDIEDDPESALASDKLQKIDRGGGRPKQVEDAAAPSPSDDEQEDR